MITTAAIGAILSGVAVLAFVGGFAVADWRSGAEIERLKSDSKLLTASNNKCVADIQNIRSAVKELESVAVERERQAQDAMKQVQPVVERRKAKIVQIRSLAPVPLDMQCEAIKSEQMAYVQSRRDDE